MRFFSLFTLVALPLAAQESLAPAEVPVEQQETVIDSESLTMQSFPDRNVFYFTGNVVVKGTNLRVLADTLEVTAMRVREDADAAIGELGSIDQIVAIGNVRIFQAGREARAGRAEVDPAIGKLVLTEDPVVVDASATVRGWRITLEQGKRRALVEQDPSGAGGRPTVRLDALPNLGFSREEEQEETEPNEDAGEGDDAAAESTEEGEESEE